MHQTSVSRSLVNALPLPGVDEIVSVAKGLITRMQAAGCERNQCESLVRRIDGLIAAANVCNGLDGFVEVLSELQAVKSRFETALKAKSKFSEILQAQNRLRAYDNLGRELTELMEKAQLQLLASTQRMLVEQFSKRSIEQNFKTIGICDISFDDKQPPTWTTSARTRSYELVRQPNRVANQFRRGRLGKLRVTYTSFSAQLDHTAAAEKAEEVLKHLSRMQHPNVAAVVGVTRGYDGLNGLVLALDGISLQRFMQTSVAGSVLARFFNGVLEIRGFVEEKKRLGEYISDINNDAFSIAPNGHLTMLILEEGLSDNSDDSGDGDEDPGVALGIEISKNEMDYINSSKSELMLRYIESLASLGQTHLTELRVLKIAAELNFDPRFSRNSWQDHTVPPFTLCLGDLGNVIDTEGRNKSWQVLEEFGDTSAECYVYDPKDGQHTCSWRSLPQTHPQYCTWVSGCRCESVKFSIECPEIQTRRKEILKRAQDVSKQQEIELDGISYVTSWTFSIKPGGRSSHTEPMTNAIFYFHCNPQARSAPRDFWGFFSTSPDPCAPKTGLEDLGLTFIYEINYRTIRIGDWWERKYQKALNEGIATIPGGYPGAYVEELSDGEDCYADEELSDDSTE